MSIAGATDVPIEIVGGLCSDMAATELPPGVSPDCQDLIFAESSARTRPGLGAPYISISTATTIQYLKTFITGTGTRRALSMDNFGNFYKENPTATMAEFFNAAAAFNYSPVTAPFANSTTLFNREYIATSDGQNGFEIPRQYDDTFFDRVSQVGPGAAPVVVDELKLVANGSIQGNNTAVLTSSTESGNIATFTTAALLGFNPGDTIVIAGVSVAGYNGTWIVLTSTAHTVTVAVSTSGLGAGAGGTIGGGYAVVTIPAGPVPFAVGSSVKVTGSSIAAYNGTFVVSYIDSGTVFRLLNPAASGLAADTGGDTLQQAGNVIGGLHQVTVIFVTRSGFLTAPAPPSSWTAGGGLRAIVTNIPIGPPNVVQRILCFTSAGGANFFYTTTVPQVFSSNMVINDNVTTSVTVDFSDPILLAGTNVDNLFDQVELAECAGVLGYSERLFWWGERSKLQNLVNPTFDGGFSNPGSAPNFPLGWTVDPTNGTGGGSGLAKAGIAVWGDSYAITGDGATATRGLITQSVSQDFRGVPILQANTDYSVRARVAYGGAVPTVGTLHVQLFSASAGISTTGLQVQLASFPVGTQALTFVEFVADLTAPLTKIPSDLVLRVYVDGTPLNGTYFVIDNIELFPTSDPFNFGLIRASGASNPESYDGDTGLVEPNLDGTAVRAMFTLRERLYAVKEHSLHATQDDGVNEPDVWDVSEVSSSVGTPSVRGVGQGVLNGKAEDWVIIAHRSGLYIFSGGEPQKISQEIGHSNNNFTLAWDQINWQYGYTIWVVVDTQERRIYIGAPFGAATSPNHVMMLDYRDIEGGAANIAGNPPIIVSYQGKKIVKDKSRKWSPWSIAANCCALIERPDGTAHLWMGKGPTTTEPLPGAIFDLQAANLTDYSTKQMIPSYYTTAFIPQREQNQMVGTHEHRKLFSYLTMFVEGSGFVNLTAIPNQFNTGFQQLLPSLILNNPAWNDLETSIDVKGERVAFKISQSGSASWFRLQKFTPVMGPDPNAPVRGVN